MFSFSFEADPQTNWRKRRLFRNLIRKAKKLLFLMRYRISEKIKCENDFEIVICHQAVVSVIISKIHIWKKVAHEKWPPPLFEKWSFGTLFSILSFLRRVGQLLFYGLMGSKFRRQERPNYVREQLWGYRVECERAIKRERETSLRSNEWWDDDNNALKKGWELRTASLFIIYVPMVLVISYFIGIFLSS